MDESLFIPALLSCCNEQARAEGLVDEDAIVDRAQEIFEDAKMETPITPVGSMVRVNAINKFETDPAYSAKQNKFDYDAYRDTRSMPAISQILAKLGEHSANLPIKAKCTDEEEKATNAAYEKITLEIFDVLNTNNVGTGEYKYIFDSLKAIITSIDEYVMQQVVGHRHEMMSRLFGAKNPGTDKFDSMYATYKNLTDSLMKVREQTGNEMSDYFNVEKTKEE